MPFTAIYGLPGRGKSLLMLQHGLKIADKYHLQQFEIKPATKMINFKDVKKGDYLEMAAYSIDLRQKILSAWQNKEGTQRELAKRFKVSLSFLRDFLRRYRETAQIAARTQGGDRRSKLKGKEQELLKIIVTEKSDIYLREIQKEIKERQGIEVSISSLSRTLNRLKLRRKKKL